MTHTFTLTAEQQRHFQAFGYVIARNVFAPDEVARFAAGMESALRRKRGGGEFTGSRSERITPLVDETPDVFRPLLDDECLLGQAEGLLGEDCLFTGSNDGNLDVGDTPWHIGRRQFGFSFASFPRQSWDETWLHGYLARINKRHGRRLLSESLFETGGPRRRAKLAKLSEMGL